MLDGGRVVPLSDGAVDLGREIVTRAGKTTPLTTREAALFAYLASRPGQTVSRDELHTEVWGYAPAVVSRTVDTTIRRLRTKIEADPSQPAHLLTVHGLGYRFIPLDAPPARAPAPTSVPPVSASTAVAHVLAAVGAHGHVGVVGVPGVGKSRLLQAVAEHLGQDGRAVRSVDAARASSPEALAHRVAGAVGISLDGEDVVRRVGAALAARGGVWVIDGVDPRALPAIGAWTRAAVIFSCRERRVLPGTAWIELGPLSAGEAAALFVARARACDPTFDAEPAVVAAIVERLDHLPLAIELAAARAHVLAPQVLLERLAEPLAVLGAGPLDRAFVAAWDGLRDAERATLAQCAVFEGAFAIDGAEAVVDGVPSVIDALTSLRDRSLLSARRTPTGLSFGLLRSVRAFVLRQAPLGEGVRARHRRWLVRHGESLVDGLDTARAPAALDELRALRTDLTVAAADGDDLGVVRILDSLLDHDGPVTDRLALLDRALTAPTVHGVVRADLLRRRADALRIAGRRAEAKAAAHEALGSAPAGDVRARALVAAAFVDDPPQALTWAREALAARPRPAVAVLAWLGIGFHARRGGERPEAELAFRRALELVRASGVVRYEGVVLANLATSRREAGLTAEAEELYVRASAACARLGQVRAAAAALHNLAGLRAERGNLGGAIEVGRDALRIARGGGEPLTVAHAAHALGHLHHRAGELVEAEECYVEAVGLLRELDPGLAASAEGDLAALLADRGLVDEAERTLAEAAGPLPEAGAGVASIHRAHVDIARARLATGPERLALLAVARDRIAAGEEAGGDRGTMAAQLARDVLERASRAREGEDAG